MQKNGYIGEFEIIDDHRAGKIVVELNGRINKCGVICPRFDIKGAEMEKWVQNLLPSRQFGHIVLTTSVGIMDHYEAQKSTCSARLQLQNCFPRFHSFSLSIHRRYRRKGRWFLLLNISSYTYT